MINVNPSRAVIQVGGCQKDAEHPIMECHAVIFNEYENTYLGKNLPQVQNCAVSLLEMMSDHFCLLVEDRTMLPINYYNKIYSFRYQRSS